MAVVTITAREFNNKPIGVRADIRVFEEDHELVTGPNRDGTGSAADPDNPTLVELVFIRWQLHPERDDGEHERPRWTPWKHVSDATMPEIAGVGTVGGAAGLRQILRASYQQAKTDEGL